MLSAIDKIPKLLEFFIVLFIALGNFIFTSTWFFIAYFRSEEIPLFISREGNYEMILTDFIVLAIVFVFLALRGYSLKDFNFKIGREEIVFGFAIALICTILPELINRILWGFNIPIKDITHWACNLNSLDILLFSVVNSFYEEFIVVGYIVTALRKYFRATPIIIFSTLLRYSYHTYQGNIALISIIPMGIVCAYIYWRWRKLSPLIIAHTILDIIGLEAVCD